MKIYSKRLNKELEINAEQINGILLIPHHALELLAYDLDLDIKVKILKDDPRHGVAEGWLKDKLGTSIQNIGEALDVSLSNDISRSYPVTMARIRAYDRCVIQYLVIPDKVYSSSEIEDKESIKPLPIAHACEPTTEEVSAETEKQQSEDGKSTNTAYPEQHENGEANSVPSPENTVKKENTSKNEEKAKEEGSDAKAGPSSSEEKLETIGNQMVTWGSKYQKNPVTVKSLFSSQDNSGRIWADLFIDKFFNNKDPKNKDKAAFAADLKFFRENMGGEVA